MTRRAHNATAQHLAQRITIMRIERIHPHSANVREDLGDVSELAGSIRSHGLLQPLLVEPYPGRQGECRLLAGHRRLAAAKLAGLDAVPVIVRHGVNDDTAIEIMLIENCQRQELNPMDKAEAFQALRNRGYTQQRIADQTGISLPSVNTYLTLIDLDEASQEKVRSGQLGVSHAVAAVRQTRKRQRKKRGSTADYSWEPDYLTGTHPLAKKARRLCDAREHTMRRRIGDTACGQCWETVIRADERTVVQAEEGAAAPDIISAPHGATRQVTGG